MASLRTVINAIKCNTPENGNINILLHGDVVEPAVQVNEEASQNPFISKLINLSNHPSAAVKAAVHATTNILFSQIPNEKRSEEELRTIVKQLVQSTKQQLDVQKQLNLVATLASLAHNQAVSDILYDLKEEGIKVLSQLAMSSGPKTQEYIINICSSISSHEKGRLLITTTEHCLKALQYLMLHSTSSEIKSLATLTIAKLEAMKKKGGFDSSTDSGILVLEQVCQHIKSSDSGMISKGVESLGYMLSNTKVKQAICGDHQILSNILGKALELGTGAGKGSKDTVGVYGLCNILQNLTMSNFDKQKDKLKEMEVTPEQWKEFEKITKMAKSESNDTPDTPQLVADRVQCLCLKHKGIEAIVHLCDVLIENKHKIKGHLEIAQTFCNITSVQEPNNVGTMIKSKIVQCGGLKSLINLHDVCSPQEDKTKSKKAKNKSKPIDPVEALLGQAISRILIYTNPSLLPHSTVLSCIQPLVANIRKSKDNLKEFEALMALTNILSLQDDSILSKVCNNHIRDIEYCQFSSHELVRQAATECFCNMIYHDEFIKYIIHNDGDKLRLWLAFAQANIDPSEQYIADDDEDVEADDITTLETSRAACGGLAMMCSVPVIANLMIKHDALAVMEKILKHSQNEEIRVRAIHCIKALREMQGAVEVSR